MALMAILLFISNIHVSAECRKVEGIRGKQSVRFKAAILIKSNGLIQLVVSQMLIHPA